jgi:steroid 5-alpha reductase family enzyme
MYFIIALFFLSDAAELTFWWSVFAVSAPALTGASTAVAALSPLFITFLLFKVSGIPLLEKASDAKYQDNKKYIEYKRNTPLLFPFF